MLLQFVTDVHNMYDYSSEVCSKNYSYYMLSACVCNFVNYA